MENYWRPSQRAPWSTLLELGNYRTALVFQYVESGEHTGESRVCRARFAEVAAAFESSPRAIKSDLTRLEAAGLLALTIQGRMFEAYPVGAWATCKATPQTRTRVLRLLDADPTGVWRTGRARVACLSEIGREPVLAPKPPKHKGSEGLGHAEGTASAPLQAKAVAVAVAKADPPVVPQGDPGLPPAPTATKTKAKRKPTLAQKPPTLDEVTPYARELGFTDALTREWHDYWTSMGWRGKAGPRRDWKAMLRSRKAQLQSWGKWSPEGPEIAPDGRRVYQRPKDLGFGL